jgi:hypothetical protein
MAAVWMCTLVLVQTANVAAIQPCFEDDPRQKGMVPLSWTLPPFRTVSPSRVEMRCGLATEMSMLVLAGVVTLRMSRHRCAGQLGGGDAGAALTFSRIGSWEESQSGTAALGARCVSPAIGSGCDVCRFGEEQKQASPCR